MFVLLLLSLPSMASAAIYKYVDKDGVTRYTDNPPSKNAKPLNLPPPSVIGVDVPSDDDADASDDKDAPNIEAASFRYGRVVLTSPSAEQVYNTGNPTVSAAANIDPGLQPEHKVVFLVDGLPVPAAGGTTSAEISGLTRGTHSIQAVVMNAGNAIQAQSEAVSIHISPPSSLQPSFSDQAPPASGNPAPNPRGVTGPTAPAPPSRPPVFTPP